MPNELTVNPRVVQGYVAREPVRRVPYVDLAAQYQAERNQILACVDRVLASGVLVGNEGIEAFETEVAAYCGTEFAVAVNSGTTALLLAMQALGIGAGDEVILPANSHYASAAAVAHLGARPVFADVGKDRNLDPREVTAKITARTKAVMPVHLGGRIAEMETIGAICRAAGLRIVEDAAQAIGSKYLGKRAGALGDAAAFSAHPLKNLNAPGDAGFITTNDPQVAETARRLRNHGLIDRDHAAKWGYCGRMDVLHAEILRLRLAGLDTVIESRRRNAARYVERLNPDGAELPVCQPYEFHSYHTFTIQADRRDLLQSFLEDRGISTAIHYPVPLHLQPAAASLGYRRGDLPETERQAGRILSLPVHQFLSDDDIDYVAAAINDFVG